MSSNNNNPAPQQQLQKEFEAAQHFIATFKPDPDSTEAKFSPSNELKLLFYSYYKQSTEGNAQGSRPSIWDVVNRAKYDAWIKLKDMSKEEAQRKYLELLDEKYPPWRQHEGLGTDTNDTFSSSSSSSSSSTAVGFSSPTVTSTTADAVVNNNENNYHHHSTDTFGPDPSILNRNPVPIPPYLSPTLSTASFASPTTTTKNISSSIYADFTQGKPIPSLTTPLQESMMVSSSSLSLPPNTPFSPLTMDQSSLSVNNNNHNNSHILFSPSSVLLQSSSTGRRLTIEDAACILERRLSHSQLSRLCAELQATVAGQNERIIQAQEQLSFIQQYTATLPVTTALVTPHSSAASSLSVSSSSSSSPDTVSIIDKTVKILKYTSRFLYRWGQHLSRTYSPFTLYGTTITALIFFFTLWYRRLRSYRSPPLRLKG